MKKLFYIIVILTLFGSCKRSGIVSYDYPEINNYLSETKLSSGDPIILNFNQDISIKNTNQALFLVESEDRGFCNPACPGKCIFGRCRVSIVDDLFLKDASDGELSETRQKSIIPIVVKIKNNSMKINLKWGALSPSSFYQLILTPNIKNGDGLPLISSNGDIEPFTINLITDTLSYESPDLTLVYPLGGNKNVPVNLRWAIIHISEEIENISDRSFVLKSDNGEYIELGVERREGICGNRDGECILLSFPIQLESSTSYSLRVVDKLIGQESRIIPAWTKRKWFKTGDLTWAWPVETEDFETEPVTGCFHVRWKVSTDGISWIQYASDDGHDKEFLVKQGEWETALTDNRKVRIVTQGIDGSMNTGPWIEPQGITNGAQKIVITEIYSNPFGPEPSQEYIEIENVSTEAVDLSDYRLTDDPEIEGDIFPSYILNPGNKLLIVGDKYVPNSNIDPNPPENAKLLFMYNSIVNGGLKNSGEPVYLYDNKGVLVSRYNGWQDFSNIEGVSVSRIPSNGCDIAYNWVLSTATPGF